MDDHHSKQSKAEGYRSRAAYKLIELDQKFKLIKKDSANVVDLGFAPGAWSQVVLARCKALGVKPNVLGVDLIASAPPTGAHFIQGDIFSRATHQAISDHFDNAPVDLVLSDMMVNTSGIKDNDHYASMELCEGVLLLACNVLRKNGNLAVKFYTGKEEKLFQTKLEKVFQKVHRAKPAACRDELREMYFVGMRKKDVDVGEIFG